ncbi:hypothetical protein [Actinoplanes sp. NPDC023714]|uniref:hypothetical protein n=1 Tax=Actinoplanes sp. NPDC023714 TaxID=3154322 RepID=UPI0033EC34E7
MTVSPQRPRFTDGQQLNASDLELTVDSARDRAARHDRVAHTPGIAAGLRLAAGDRQMMTHGGQSVGTVPVTVTAGVAIDGDGRLVVVPDDEPLTPEQFRADVLSPAVDPDYPGTVTTFPYPVILSADDRDAAAPPFDPGGCGTSGPTRTAEGYQIRIGRRDEHLALAAQPRIGFGEPLTAVARPYRVLLGFVRFHTGLNRYVEVYDEVGQVRVRPAGVRAGEVIADRDRLLLRLGDPAAAGQPAMVLDARGLRFGALDAAGGVADVFSVSPAGDVTLGGQLDPAVSIAGAVGLISGVATDGMPLPLPPGVTEEEVAAGKVILHIWVTPGYPPPQPGTAFLVSRCEVDRQRVAHCRLQRVTMNPPALDDGPAAVCRFVVAAARQTGTGP